MNLVNTGRVTLHIATVRVTGEHADDFSLAATRCAATELAAGQACTTTVVFIPTGEGARSAGLVVDVTELDDDPQLPLSGAGSEPDPAAVTVDPAVLAFDDQRVGTRGPGRSIQLNGPVTGEVALGAAVVEGQHAADFTITSDGCADVSLGPGRSCTLDIHFGPSYAGPRTALLRISAGDGTPAAAVPLRGAAAPGPPTPGTPPTSTGTPGTPPTSTGTPGTPPIVTSKPTKTRTGPPVPRSMTPRRRARSLLDSAGLVPGTVTSQASDTVAEGVVISSDPEPGSLVEPGSEVALIGVVRTGTVRRARGAGHGPRPGRADHRAVLRRPRARHLTTGRRRAPGRRPGDQPRAGRPGRAGTAVSLTVSERGVRVPDVVGRTFDEAKTAIEAAGLQVGKVKFAEVTDNGLVKSSNPVAKTVVCPGQIVDLVAVR